MGAATTSCEASTPKPAEGPGLAPAADSEAILEQLQDALAEAALARVLDWWEVDSILRSVERRCEWWALLEDPRIAAGYAALGGQVPDRSKAA